MNIVEHEPEDPPKEFVLAVLEFLTELGYAHNCISGTIHVTRTGYMNHQTVWISFDSHTIMVLVQNFDPTALDVEVVETCLDLQEPDSFDKLEAILKENLG